MPDPYDRMNELTALPLMENDFVFETDFTLTQEQLAGDFLTLRLRESIPWQKSTLMGDFWAAPITCTGSGSFPSRLRREWEKMPFG